MDRLYIILAAFIGGLAVALIGWCESHEHFDTRKFGGSAIRAVIAAVIFAVGYHLTGPVCLLDLLYAFLGGAGVDALGNRIAGSFGKGSFPIPAKKTTPE
jgi:hypothetical protein